MRALVVYMHACRDAWPLDGGPNMVLFFYYGKPPQTILRNGYPAGRVVSGVCGGSPAALGALALLGGSRSTMFPARTRTLTGASAGWTQITDIW